MHHVRQGFVSNLDKESSISLDNKNKSIFVKSWGENKTDYILKKCVCLLVKYLIKGIYRISTILFTLQYNFMTSDCYLDYDYGEACPSYNLNFRNIKSKILIGKVIFSIKQLSSFITSMLSDALWFVLLLNIMCFTMQIITIFMLDQLRDDHTIGKARLFNESTLKKSISDCTSTNNAINQLYST